MKLCFKCHHEKPLTEFYRHPRMADGVFGKCKDCAKRDVQENRAARLCQYRSYELLRYHNGAERKDALSRWAKAHPESRRASTARFRANNPDKVRAHAAVNRAKRSGHIESKPCSRCGASRTHAHHADYSQPLAVEWLCPAHHRTAHNADRGI